MSIAFRATVPFVCAIVFVANRTGGAAAPTTAPVPPTVIETTAQLFQPTRVWTVHLRFSAEQWTAMEPTGTPDWSKVFVGGPLDPASAAAGSFASAMLKRGDRNRDGKLDRDEFLSLAAMWFTRWDRAKAGVLDLEQLQSGLNLTLDPEGLTQEGGFPITLRGAKGKRNGLASSLGIEFKQVHAGLEFEGADFKDIAVRYKGNGTFVESRASLKRSLKLELNRFSKGQTLAKLSKLNFHNNVADASYMNEAVSYQLYREAGVPSPRTSYARLYVTVPSKHDRRYFGLYTLVENIDADFAEDRFGTSKGAIFKPVTPSLFADLGEDWSDYEQTYDPKTNVSPEQARRVIEFAALLTYADDAQFAARLGDYVDLDEFARYMAVTTYLATMDSILASGQNFYVYLHPETGKFQFIPWDLDHSFGQIFGEQEQLANLSIHHPWAGPNRFLERVFGVEAFKKMYLARLDEFSRTLFRPERFHQQVDAIAAAIRPAIDAESRVQVAKFDKTVAGGSIKAKGGWFAPAPVKSIKGFVDVRTPSVLAQLAGKSQGELAKGLGGGWGGRRGGPGKILTPAFRTAMDVNKDGKFTRAEFAQGFEEWFKLWNTGPGGMLTDEMLRAGIGKALSPSARGTPSTTRPSPSTRPALTRSTSP